MFNGMSLGDLEAFLDKQEKLSAGAEEGEEGRPGSGQQGGCVDVHRAEQSQTRGETLKTVRKNIKLSCCLGLGELAVSFSQHSVVMIWVKGWSF